VADQMAMAHRWFPFEFVLMLGDNLYGDEDPEDYREKFEQPYQPLLDAGVKFYAALGNHDDPNQRFYERFHMGGDRYYTFNASTQSVRFFALDTNYMDPEQLRWLRTELESSNSEWTICFFHHPLYSSGERHGSNLPLRKTLEPLFVEHNVDVVFSGHDHVYERIKPQHGIYYFVSGNSAKLRRGGLAPSRLTAKGFDQGQSFMLIAIAGRVLQFQTISSEGRIVDAGLIRARPQELSGALGISLAHRGGAMALWLNAGRPTGSTDAAGRGVSPDHPCGAAGDGCDGPHREARRPPETLDVAVVVGAIVALFRLLLIAIFWRSDLVEGERTPSGASLRAVFERLEHRSYSS
jgi:predicted MPP superfamily phosphohydrolase